MDTKRSLHVVNLSCVRQHTLLFAHISFQLKSGEALLIEGPNGSGKSSLLRLITGLARAAGGEIFWQDKLIQDARNDEYSNNFHYVSHANGIKLGLTVDENLQLARHLSLSALSDEYEYVLSLLQLNAYKNTQARYLSAGQKRRLALAKLFLFTKPLWILDEPLTTLDVNTQAMFFTRLQEHLKNGGIAIISSHHPININEGATQILRLKSC